ncbi:MAG: hypothetical protein ACRELA_24825, partial [Candidatus Rokuibacteriota bacterium]
MMGWVRQHRGLTAFAAGVLLTLATAAAVGYLVLSDQRRSARVLAAALSQALAREVRIDRVTQVSAARVVMRGVSLARDGGWPADVAVETVEATGPLLAVARGETAPVRLVVTRPTVTLPDEAGGGLGPLETLRQGIASFLSGPLLLDVSLTGGKAQQGAATVEFDLGLRKGPNVAKGELTLRQARGAPFTLTLDARMEGDTPRVALCGGGPLRPVSE